MSSVYNQRILPLLQHVLPLLDNPNKYPELGTALAKIKFQEPAFLLDAFFPILHKFKPLHQIYLLLAAAKDFPPISKPRCKNSLAEYSFVFWTAAQKICGSYLRQGEEGKQMQELVRSPVLLEMLGDSFWNTAIMRKEKLHKPAGECCTDCSAMKRFASGILDRVYRAINHEKQREKAAIAMLQLSNPASPPIRTSSVYPPEWEEVINLYFKATIFYRRLIALYPQNTGNGPTKQQRFQQLQDQLSALKARLS